MDAVQVLILVGFIVTAMCIVFLFGRIQGMRMRIDAMTDGYITELEEEVEKLREKVQKS